MPEALRATELPIGIPPDHEPPIGRVAIKTGEKSILWVGYASPDDDGFCPNKGDVVEAMEVYIDKDGVEHERQLYPTPGKLPDL